MTAVRLLALAGAAVLLSGQAPPPQDPVAAIKAQLKSVGRDGSGHYTGAGWDALIADGAGAQFFMVGEQHATQDIAEIEAAMHATLAKRGYTHSALEVGPYSTRHAERLIRSGPGKLQAYIAAPGHAFTLPFLFFAGEAAMAETMVATSPDRQQALFGLDQEFVGAGPILADALRAAASSDAQRKAVTGFAAAVAKDMQLVGNLTEVDLAPLDAAFKGNARGTGIIEAMRISARIYRPFVKGEGSGYLSNLERETYMKANFVRDFEAARRRNGKPPKTFFKFGGFHAMRGMSGTNVPALGNFLAEWGLPQGYRMVNVMVDCIGGEAMNPQTSKAAPCESYFGKDSAIYRAVAGAGPGVQIVDLRALRPPLRRLTPLDEASKSVILGFDYYVAVHDGRAATFIGTAPMRVGQP